MTFGRLAATTISAGLVAAAVSVTVDAQFGNPLKKLPKPPSLPAPATPAQPAAKPYGAGITDDMVTRFLKAIKVQKEVLAKEMTEVDALKAKAQAQKAKMDALATRRAEGMVGTMMQTEECKDAFKEKDPRTKEIARLEDQVAAADSAGDETKSEALRKKLDPLNMALDVEADRACGGKGSAALHDCMDKKKAALARQGVTEPMLSIQAQSECMQDPTTSGFAGATAASAEEEAAKREEDAASREAAEAMKNAQANAERAGYEAAGLTAQQFAMLDHCIRNRVNGGPGCAEDSNIVIDRYREELKRAVGA